MAIATASANSRTDGSIWARLSNYSDLVLAAGVCGIVGMMIVPLPEWMLDLLIITNLSLGLVMLMVALYARDALEFSVFPSLLLLTTLFRSLFADAVAIAIYWESAAGRRYLSREPTPGLLIRTY